MALTNCESFTRRPVAIPLRYAVAAALTLGFVTGAFASEKLTESEKIDLLRGLTAEIGVSRTTFPRADKPLQLSSDGKILNDRYMRQAAINYGAVLSPGDRFRITNIKFRGDAIVLDLNGGLGEKKKWYEHLEVGMGGTMTPVTSNRARYLGAEIVLQFKGGLPHLTVDQVKQYLSPVIDWNLHAAAEVQVAKLPPIVRDAIQRHDVLVGMNTDMVLASKGRPPQKIREKDEAGDDYEDWIYGQPPNAVFVRVQGDRVIRVTEYHSDGTKVEKTQPEVILAHTPQRPAPSATSAQADAGEQRPTLRRPGEQPIITGGGAGGPGPINVPGAPAPVPGSTEPAPLPPPGQPGGPTAPPSTGVPGQQPPQ